MMTFKKRRLLNKLNFRIAELQNDCYHLSRHFALGGGSEVREIFSVKRKLYLKYERMVYKIENKLDCRLAS